MWCGSQPADNSIAHPAHRRLAGRHPLPSASATQQHLRLTAPYSRRHLLWLATRELALGLCAHSTRRIQSCQKCIYGMSTVETRLIITTYIRACPIIGVRCLPNPPSPPRRIRKPSWTSSKSTRTTRNESWTQKWTLVCHFIFLS